METLKIFYADFWPEWKDENFIEPILRKHFNLIIDPVKPDVLFHSIFGGMKESQKYSCKKIQYIGENRDPTGTNYSISFRSNSETNYNLPLWQVYLMINPELKDRLFNRIYHEKFDRFASFIVSNPGNFFRNGAFQQLSNYKFVHSYGRYMNNDMGLVNYSQGKYWRKAKDDFFLKNRHKFMFAFENNAYPGYCTEKLMDGFLVGSIPIYWGDQKAKYSFNPKSFINAMDPNWLEEVKKLDADNSAFDEYYNQPIFLNNQKDALIENIGLFEEWLIDKIKNG